MERRCKEPISIFEKRIFWGGRAQLATMVILISFAFARIIELGEVWEWTSTTRMSFRLKTITFSVCSTSGTLNMASGHADFPGLPVDLRVVFTEPGVSENKMLLAKASDMEDGAFCMSFKT